MWGCAVIHRGRHKTMTDQHKHWLNCRQAIEQMIGHAKSDNSMDWCWLLRAIDRLGLKMVFLRQLWPLCSPDLNIAGPTNNMYGFRIVKT